MLNLTLLELLGEILMPSYIFFVGKPQMLPCHILDVLTATGDLPKIQVEVNILYFDFLNPASVHY